MTTSKGRIHLYLRSRGRRYVIKKELAVSEKKKLAMVKQKNALTMPVSGTFEAKKTQ